MSVRSAGMRISQEVSGWKGVQEHPHRYGGVEFRLGKREIGHLHGDSLLDIPFPVKVREEVVASGRASAHHLLPDSGWVSFFLRQEDDVRKALELLRISYDIAVASAQRRARRDVMDKGTETATDPEDEGTPGS